METTDEEAVGKTSPFNRDIYPVTNLNNASIEETATKSNDILPTPLELKDNESKKETTSSNGTNEHFSESIQTETDKITESNSTVEQSADKIKSRELKSLIAAVKESNLETNISHKRKSLTEQSNDRRNSTSSNENVQLSVKRNMRSHNPEFAAKHQKFISKVAAEFNLNAVHEIDLMSENKKDKETNMPSLKRKRDDSNAVGNSVEEKKARKGGKVESSSPMKPGKDRYCWICHREGISLYCVACPRSFHSRCLRQNVIQNDEWMCPECISILKAENNTTRSNAMKRLTQDKLGQILRFALKRMKDTNGSEPFLTPVDTKVLPDYLFYVEQPMDMSKLQDNIRENMYGSTEAFLADTKWILHNSIIYNSSQSKLTSVAKKIVKKCKAEMYEIETCPECYNNANTQKDTWFIEACSQPHLLVWAKLKGYPYWPAKAVNTSNQGTVDVRFFGDHDKAWIPIKDVFLYSKKDPNTTNLQKNSIAESIKEVDLHIEKLKEKFKIFNYAPYRVNLEPENFLSQLQTLLPNYQPSSNHKSMTPITITKSNKKNSNKTKVVISNKIAQSSINNNGNSVRKLLDTTKTIDSEKPNSPMKFLNNSESVPEDYASEDDEDTTYYMGRRRKLSKLIGSSFNSDTESEEEKSNTKNISPPQIDYDSSNSAKKTPRGFFVRGKVRTRGGYPNTSGRLKILPNLDFDEKVKNNSDMDCFEILGNNNAKFERRNSDVSSKSFKSDMSHLSEKINRVEFSEMTEVTIGNVFESNTNHHLYDTDDKPAETMKLKPIVQVNTGDLLNTDLELRISPLKTSSGSIADKLMKKIAESERNVCQSENGEVQITKIKSVKKKLLQSDATNDHSSNEVENELNSKDLISSENFNTRSNEMSVKSLNENLKNSTISNCSDMKSNQTDTESKQTEELNVQNLSNTYKIQSDSLAQLVSSVEKSIKKKKSFIMSDDKSDMSATDGSDFHSVSESSSESSDDEPESDRSNKDQSKITVVDVSKIILGESSGLNKKDDNNQIECNSLKNSNIQISSHLMDKKVDYDKKGDTNSVNDEITNESCSKWNKKSDPKSSSELRSSKFPVPFTNIEIKEEYIDSDESEPELLKNRTAIEEFFPALNLAPSVKISLVEKQKFGNVKMDSLEPIKSATDVLNNLTIDLNIDNVTKTIESVVKGDGKPRIDSNKSENEPPKKSELKVISVAEINKKRSAVLGNKVSIIPKQSARKSFSKPSSHIRAITSESIKNINTSKSNKSELNKCKLIQDSLNKALESNKDKVVYISAPSSSNMNSSVTLLPQNITLESGLSVNNNILTMLGQTGQSKMSLYEIHSQGTNTVPKNVLGYQMSHKPTRNVSVSSTAPSSTITSEKQNEMSVENCNISEGMPQLQKRPVGPLSSDHSDDGILSAAGPSTLMLNQASQKLADYFRSIIKETLSDVSKLGCNDAKVKELQLEIEVLTFKYKQEINSLKSELATLKEAYTAEKQQALQELRKHCEQERMQAVDEAKSKQWCAICLRESQYRCCWNTSYCGYPCQRAHWPLHQTRCQQGFETNSEINKTHYEQRDFSTNISSTSLVNTTTSSPTNNSAILKSVKHTYLNKSKSSTKIIQKNVPPKTTVIVSKQSGSNSSTATASSSLTFVETTTGMEVIGNSGPIAIGGKLITSSLPTKIKGFIVSNSNVNNVVPALAALSNKSLSNIASQNITKNSISTTTITSSTSSLSSINSTSAINQSSDPSADDLKVNNNNNIDLDNNEVTESDGDN